MDLTQYEFGLEVLADFLIARSMMNEFPKDDERAQVDLIKDKREKMWELSEAIILVLFDRLVESGIVRTMVSTILNGLMRVSFGVAYQKMLDFRAMKMIDT